MGNSDKQRRRRGRLRLVREDDGTSPTSSLMLAGAGVATVASLLLLRKPVAAFGFALGLALMALIRKPPGSPSVQPEINTAEPVTDSLSLSQVEGYIFIDAPASAVYQHARRLSYFRDAIPEVAEVEEEANQNARLDVFDGVHHWHIDLSIVADEENDFFAFRVEHDTTMFGTCLIRFETTPGNTGTIVRITCRDKAPAQALDKVKLVNILNREIKTYLQSLKAGCETARPVPSP